MKWAVHADKSTFNMFVCNVFSLQLVLVSTIMSSKAIPQISVKQKNNFCSLAFKTDKHEMSNLVLDNIVSNIENT